MSVKFDFNKWLSWIPKQGATMTKRETIWPEDLRDAADENGPPLGRETLSSINRALADVAAGRVKLLEEYEREREL